MEIIKTKSFELAIITQGDKNASKIAILLPGRLDTKDYTNNVSHIYFLAGKGYFALSLDPPGSWDSPGGLEIYSTTNYIKAVNELIEYYGNRPTLLLGHSRGGTVSILTGSVNPHVTGFVCMMASYGRPTQPAPEDVQDGVLMEPRDLPPGTTRTSKQIKFALPMNYFKDAEQYEPYEILKSCTKPKLIFYGNKDKFTKPDRVKEVFVAIPEPKMLHELNSDHDYRLHSEVINEVNKTIGEFLDKYPKL